MLVFFCFCFEATLKNPAVKIYDGEKNRIEAGSLDGKMIGLYFSAHWYVKFSPNISWIPALDNGDTYFSIYVGALHVESSPLVSLKSITK